MSQALRDLVEVAIVVDPFFDQNCYVLRRRDTTHVLVIDPGLQHPRALELLDRHALSCDLILCPRARAGRPTPPTWSANRH
jgi:glyoxylase-like metal-dependent hydrolase (beta-lactamase superfamily II)